MDTGDRTVIRTVSPLAIAAIIISIVALVLAWMAYNRTGKDLEDMIADQVQRATQTTQNATDSAGEATKDATDSIEQGLDTGPDGVDDGAQ